MNTTIRTKLPGKSAHAHQPEMEVLPLYIQLVNLLAVVLPFAGFIVAVILLWGRGFDWLQLSLFTTMYILTGIGVTVGYHRLFTHRSFQTYRPVKFILAVLGSMAMQGPLFKWVATHRHHHTHSDGHDDPHSPHHHGSGLVGLIRGLWHAHVGWILKPRVPNLSRHITDLLGDRLLRFVHQTFTLWAVLGMLIPATIAGLVTMSWTGALLGFLWGGLARVFIVHHLTWSINSVCHLWGTRPFRSSDESRNNFVFGVLGLGEGWHNNHHAFPTSARHGLRWWEFDASYYIIRAMQALRLAWDVRVPPPQALLAKSAG